MAAAIMAFHGASTSENNWPCVTENRHLPHGQQHGRVQISFHDNRSPYIATTARAGVVKGPLPHLTEVADAVDAEQRALEAPRRRFENPNLPRAQCLENQTLQTFGGSMESD